MKDLGILTSFLLARALEICSSIIFWLRSSSSLSILSFFSAAWRGGEGEGEGKERRGEGEGRGREEKRREGRERGKGV